MLFIYILLTIIAIGVLLASSAGQTLLKIIAIFIGIILICLLIYATWALILLFITKYYYIFFIIFFLMCWYWDVQEKRNIRDSIKDNLNKDFRKISSNYIDSETLINQLKDKGILDKNYNVLSKIKDISLSSIIESKYLSYEFEILTVLQKYRTSEVSFLNYIESATIVKQLKDKGILNWNYHVKKNIYQNLANLDLGLDERCMFFKDKIAFVLNDYYNRSMPNNAFCSIIPILNHYDNDAIKKQLKEAKILDENYRVTYNIELNAINLDSVLDDMFLPFKEVILYILQDHN
jgi:hypothetical protein